ncbi:MAG: hypothetical protein SCH71_05275 [Desulfobulbaceae bacterium]|nr:hypothetical protein [Desulfobulbaceae bacterium]
MSITNCWEVIKCEESENCLARRYSDIPCWEIDRKYNSSQAVLDVCKECKVFILHENRSLLMDNQLNDVRQLKEVMKFVKKCPAYNNCLQNEDGMPV